MASFSIRPLAWKQINIELDYLEQQAGVEIAERFLDCLINSFKTLAQTPAMGVKCNFRRPAIRSLRRWPVKQFENWLIFYQPKDYGIEIVHVLHGARDIESLLK